MTKIIISITSILLSVGLGSIFSINKNVSTNNNFETYSEITEVYNFESNIVGSPTVWSKFQSKDKLMSKTDSSPISLVVKLDDDLNIIDSNNKKNEFFEIIDLIYKRIIPVFEIDSNIQATKLSELLNEFEFKDYFVLSNNSDYLNKVKENNVNARTVLKVDENLDYNDSSTLKNLLLTFNKSNAQSLLLENTNINKLSVEYLQKRGVFVITTSTDDNVSLFSNLILGVNGIYVDGDYTNLYQIYNDVPINTVIRNTFAIAHRGYHVQAAENTIEAGLEAIKHGAEIIELDVQLTTDLEVVVIHDTNTARVSDENVPVDSFWSRLKNVKLNNQLNQDMYIPLFKDYLETFKTKDVVLFVEIKVSSDKLVEKTLELIEEYDMSHNVIIISFNSSDLVKSKELLPSVGFGHLHGGITESNRSIYMEKVIDWTMPFNSKFNPSNSSLSKENIHDITSRGLTIWPWTINGQELYKEYFKGVSGLTTDTSNVLGLIPNKINLSKTKDNLSFKYQSEVFLKNGTPTEEQVLYSVLEDKNKLLDGINEFNNFSINKEGRAYLLGSVKTILPNNVEINYIVDVWEINNDPVENNETRNNSLYIIGAVSLLSISLGALIILNNKRKNKKEK